MQASNQKHSGKSAPAVRAAAKEPGAPTLSNDQSASEQAAFQTRSALRAAQQFLGKVVLTGDLKASLRHTHFLPKKSFGAYDQYEHKEGEDDEIAILRPNDARGDLFEHTDQDTSEQSPPERPHSTKHNHGEA